MTGISHRHNLDNSSEILNKSNLDSETENYIFAMEELVAASQELASARSLEDIMNVVRITGRQIAGADGATFVLKDEDKCYYVDENAIGPLWKGLKFPLTSCISGWAMLNKKPVAIEDIYKDGRIPIDAYRPTFVKSLVMVPVGKHDPVAAIGNYWSTNHKATDKEIAVLQSLADMVAVAMENVKNYQSMQDRIKSLEEAS